MKPSLDYLESRNLLTCGAVSFLGGPTGGLAIVQGTSGNDHISVGPNADGTYTVTLDGQRTILPATTRYLYISGGGGNDHITNNTGLLSAIHGGAGNDKIVAGTGYNSIYGDEGNDDIIAPDADYVQQDPDPDSPGEIPIIPDLGGRFVVLYTPSGDHTYDVNPVSETGSEVIFDGIFDFPESNNRTVIIDNTGAGDVVVNRNTDAINVIVLDRCS